MYQAQIARQGYNKTTGAEPARISRKHAATHRGTGAGLVAGFLALLVACALHSGVLSSPAFQSSTVEYSRAAVQLVPAPQATAAVDFTSPAIVSVLAPLPAPTAGPAVTSSGPSIVAPTRPRSEPVPVPAPTPERAR